ncbi:MAG: EF-hand domain-containing protein [Planctomycetaceae bacterium]
MTKFTVSLLASFIMAAMFIAPTFGADEKKDAPDPEVVFKKLDKDGDSKLSFEEFKGKREEEKARKAFDAKDKNKDGSLSLEEFKAMPKKKKDA